MSAKNEIRKLVRNRMQEHREPVAKAFSRVRRENPRLFADLAAEAGCADDHPSRKPYLAAARAAAPAGSAMPSLPSLTNAAGNSCLELHRSAQRHFVAGMSPKDSFRSAYAEMRQSR